MVWFVVVQLLSCVRLLVTPGTAAHQASLGFAISRVCSNSCPVTRWCHPTISSSVAPFSSCLQSFLASGYFPMSRLFTSGSQRIGASASALVLPMNSQSWFPLGLTGLISLQSKGLSRVFSSTPVWKHQWLLWGEVIFGKIKMQPPLGVHTWDGVTQSSVWKHDVWVCWGCSNVISYIIWLNQQIFISSHSGNWEVQDQFGLANLVSGKSSLPTLQTATFSPCPQMTAFCCHFLEGH